VAISDIASDSAVIAWSTSVPAWGKVLYGKTETYGDSVIAAFELNGQKVTLKGLEPSAAYHFVVLATDGKGQELARSHDYIFNTNPSRDTTPYGNAIQNHPDRHKRRGNLDHRRAGQQPGAVRAGQLVRKINAIGFTAG
jgi:hypothetical protein